MLWTSSSQSNNNTHRRKKTHKLISKNKKRTLGQHWATSAFFMASFIELLSATPCVDLFSLEWADLQVINDFLPAVLKGTPCVHVAFSVCKTDYRPPHLLGSPKPSKIITQDVFDRFLMGSTWKTSIPRYDDVGGRGWWFTMLDDDPMFDSFPRIVFFYTTRRITHHCLTL